MNLVQMKEESTEGEKTIAFSAVGGGFQAEAWSIAVSQALAIQGADDPAEGSLGFGGRSI